jgi:hypothetical protein
MLCQSAAGLVIEDLATTYGQGIGSHDPLEFAVIEAEILLDCR